MEDSYFFWGEVAIAECILEITLFEGKFFFNSHTDEETEGFGTKHGRILLWFGPYLFFMIVKDYNTRLGPEGQENFILLDGEYAHSWYGSWAATFSHCTILAEDDAFEGAHVFNESLLFVIALTPPFTVRVGMG